MLACAPGWAAAGPLAPDPSPDVSTLAPDPAPDAAPATRPAVESRAAQPVRIVTPTAVVRSAPATTPAKPKRAPKRSRPAATTKKRPAPEARPATLDLTARIDQSIRAWPATVADRLDPTLLAALGLLSLALASSSLLWLLRRAEELR